MPRAKRPMRPEDYYRLRFVSDPQISPDGKWVACVIAQPDREKDRNLSDLWLISVNARQRIQLTNRFHRDSSPRWSPDSSRLAFLAPETDDGKARPQLWVIPVSGGEAHQLTHLKQGVSSPAWSPDGKRIAFLARSPKPEDEERDPRQPKIDVKAGRVFASDVKVIDRLRYRSARYPPKEDQRHIYLVPAAGGRPRKLTDGDCDDTEPTWSPDGKRIAFTSNRARDPDWDLVGDIHVVPVSGGKPRRLTDLPGGASQPQWSPDGRRVAFIGSPSEKLFRLEHQLWVQPARGGKATSLTASLDRMPTSPCWLPDGSGLYFLCQDEGFLSLWRAGLKGEVARALPKQRVIAGYSVARRTGAIVYWHTSPDEPGELFACSPDLSRLRRLTNENGSFLRGVTIGATESFWCRSADGARIHGWRVKPPGFRQGRKYPLVLLIHGGPYAAYLQGWQLDAQMLAARGYVVVYCNPRGSTSYGREFAQAIVKKFGRDDSPDVLAAVSHAIRQGYVDPKRMGVTGGSYGGFLTIWLLGTTHRFRAGVALCSNADQRIQYYTSDITMWREQQFGRPPWEEEQSYRRASPSTHAHNIRSPLLLLHAEDDTRCPIVNSEIVYTTVKRLGVEAVFVRYPSGNHGFARSAPRFACDTLNRIGDWFDRHLKGQTPPG